MCTNCRPIPVLSSYKIFEKLPYDKLYQTCKSGRAFRVGPGSGLSLSKCFGPISGTHTQVFIPFEVTIFLSSSTFVLITGVTSVSDVIVIFLQLIPFENTAAFFCSLLGLVSHSFPEGAVVRKLERDGTVSKRSITYAILRLC